MAEYTMLRLSRQGQVATIVPLVEGTASRGSLHWELADAFTELRADNGIRIVVVTGEGDTFFVPPPAAAYSAGGGHDTGPATDPARLWRTFMGIVRCHQTMAEMEKPIVARVNGDAIGFGSSLAFACDLIVAVEDARFMDHHMGGAFQASYGGETKRGGHEEYSVVPGDGGALIPLHLSPCKAKEYLMLCEPMSAVELAQLGVINYAVPASQLDAKVDQLVAALLRRDAHALAWTKRVVNRRVAEQLNLTLDASVAYEMASFHELHRLGGSGPKDLA